MTTSREQTKQAMMTDAQKLKAANILKKMGIKDVNTTINNIESKYGAYGYDMVVKAAMEPYNVASKAGATSIKTSAQAIRYIEKTNLSAATVSKVIGKTVDPKKMKVSNTPARKPAANNNKTKMDIRAAARRTPVTLRVQAAPAISTRTTLKTPVTVQPKKKTTPTKTTRTVTKTTAANTNPLAAPQKPKIEVMDWKNVQSNRPTLPGLDNIPSTLPNPAKTKTSPTVKTSPTAKPKTAEDLYKSIAIVGDRDVSVTELMQKAGVTPADLQAVLAKDAANVKKLKPCYKSKQLARAADKVEGKAQGSCLGGVMGIFNNAGIGVNIESSDPAWDNIKEFDGRAKNRNITDKNGKTVFNSGCNTYKVLNQKDFFTVSVPMSQSDAYMKAALPGTVLSYENKPFTPTEKADILHGRKKDVRNDGEVHGHVVVKRNDGRYACDGVQTAVNTARYGKHMFLSFSNDTTMPKELALDVIREAQARQAREQARLKSNQGR